MRLAQSARAGGPLLAPHTRRQEAGEEDDVTVYAAAPEAPTKPVETPIETPSRQEPPPGEKGREKDSEPDLDEQIKRIIREIPDPTPQPGGQ